MEFELLLIIILFVFIFLSLVIYKYVENEKINKLKNKENNNYIVEKIFIEDIPDKDDDSLETCTKSKCDSIDSIRSNNCRLFAYLIFTKPINWRIEH